MFWTIISLNAHSSLGHLAPSGSGWCWNSSRSSITAESTAIAICYPHRVDLVAAKQMIHGTPERPDRTASEKVAILGENV